VQALSLSQPNFSLYVIIIIANYFLLNGIYLSKFKVQKLETFLRKQKIIQEIKYFYLTNKIQIKLTLVNIKVKRTVASDEELNIKIFSMPYLFHDLYLRIYFFIYIFILRISLSFNTDM
jgi:hypothetical protein